MSAVKYKVSEKVVISTIGDEAVILDPIKGSYYGLDEIGVDIWQELNESPKSIDELCVYIQSNYDVSEDECVRDITALIVDFLEAGLVIEE